MADGRDDDANDGWGGAMALSGDDTIEGTIGLWGSVVTQTADCTAGGGNGLWDGTSTL